MNVVGLSSDGPALVVKEVMGFLVRSGHILLGRRLSGRATGTISGFGGRLLDCETAEAGLVREVEEECGVRCLSARYLAFLKIITVDDNLRTLDMHAAKIFWCSEYEGALVSSSEMQPFWCKIDDIPYGAMWDSDIHWLPLAM